MNIESSHNEHVNKFVDDSVDRCKPERVEWITGDEAQYEKLREIACGSGELIKLNEKTLPGCYLHRTKCYDTARDDDRNFIATKHKKDAGPINNWVEPGVAMRKVGKIFNGCMKGRTMYVAPYSMGAVGSKFSKIGILITDSIYVLLSMSILTRMGTKALKALGDSDDFVRTLHSKAQLDENKRYLVQFTEENTIWSVNSEYDGVLLGKKSFALRLASYYGKKEGWLAEHMMVMGVEAPTGEVRYIAAAFPSSCGKKNLAMLVPPEVYRRKGYKVWCVGDDVAWLHVGEDGRLWAVNPENGFFGVAVGTNEKSNPNGLLSVKKNTIFTNVVHDVDGNSVWWEGLNENPPAHSRNWRGENWNPEKGDKGAHPNGRYIAPSENCPNLSKKFNEGEGVPITAIIFGGRRSKTVPLVFQSRDWNNGVFTGSIMASETTSASRGDVGVVRRDPMAMGPFLGYDMADYLEHFIEMGKKIKNKPQIFNVNWFRTDEDGNFIWPGHSDNLRVIQWILKRCEGEVSAEETAIGYLPFPCDINIDEMENMDEATLTELISIDVDSWLDEVKDIREFYNNFEELPKQLVADLDDLENRLKEKKEEKLERARIMSM